MNNMEVIGLVSSRSGINPGDCAKVIKALEDVLAEGLSERQWKMSVFDKVCSAMNRIGTRRDKKRF